jgi:hypothetical protein
LYAAFIYHQSYPQRKRKDKAMNDNLKALIVVPPAIMFERKLWIPALIYIGILLLIALVQWVMETESKQG